MQSIQLRCFTLALVAIISLRIASAQEFAAGIGRADITPTEPIRLAGYASRNKPSEGIDQKLFAKALALRDQAGAVTLIVTADTIGTPRSFNDELAGRLERELSVPRARFLFASSHSHATPVIHGCLDDMYGLTGDEAKVVENYTRFFLQKSFEAAQAAVKNLEPVRLSFGSGQAHFAVNRRVFGAKGVQFGVNPDGMVENDVPVLRIDRADGTLKGIFFGYACHCTTLGGDYYNVNGDWAGFAQEYLELTYPGATALFITGCGADANPNPRGHPIYARQHGLALAGSVARALNETMTPVSGPLQAAFERVELPFDTLPGPEYYEAKLKENRAPVQRYAQRHLDLLARGEKLMTSQPCPVQVLRFGNDLTLVALGGEVVVDYSYRLRRELPHENVWVSAYCNDVFAYVPSMRILTEGGYEADFNLIYYGLPTRFSMSVEDILVKRVLEMVQNLKTSAGRK